MFELSAMSKSILAIGFFLLGIKGFSQEVVSGEFIVLLKPEHQWVPSFEKYHVRTHTLVGRSIQLIRIPSKELKLTSKIIDELRLRPEVELVEPNYVYSLEVSASSEVAGEEVSADDPYVARSWNLENRGQADGWGRAGRLGIDSGVTKAWGLQRGSRNVIVAVIDSGLNYQHPEFQNNIWTNPLELNGKPGVDDDQNGFVDDIHGYDFVNSDADPMDDHGHGTHVASIIGAQGNNGIGVAGVNWEVSLMPIKFASQEGKGTLELGIKSIQYATLMGARIINNSWGGRGYSEILSRVVEEANAKGILFVAAAGNSGTDNADDPIFPASLRNLNVISVAAFDQHGQFWNNSCYGSTTVHLGAPGVEVWGLWKDKYRSMSGTSLAAPHVTGVAALLLAQEPQMTLPELKDRLLRTSKPIANLRGKTITGATVDGFYALTNQVAKTDEEDPVFWKNKKELQISSPHPYPDQYRQEWEIKVDGAQELSLFFESFELEYKVDHVDLFDRTGRIYALTGKTGKGWSPIIKGDYVKVVFVSDSVNTAYGFDLRQVAYR